MRAGALAAAKLLAICYGSMAIGFPLVIWAFGLRLGDGWGLLTARHYGLLIVLGVAPLILAGVAVFQLVMHELCRVLGERLARTTGKDRTGTLHSQPVQRTEPAGTLLVVRGPARRRLGH
jgi:hypothetical protein